MSTTTSNDFSDLARWQRLAFLIGGVGTLVCLICVLVPALRADALRALLVAFCLCVGVSIGSLVIVMLQYLTGGEWGFILRRPLEAATRTLPLTVLFYLPIAFSMPVLYEWARPEAVAESANLKHKALYLNVPFAWVRAAIYFVIWIALATTLSNWSRQQDEKRDPAVHKRCEVLSAPGIILYVLTITFASVDWVMSLEPEWFSTIYGAMFGMGQVLSAFAFGVVILMLLGNRSPIKEVLANQSLRDLGSLLLAFVMVWAYLSFSQFLLIWSGNLPEEVPWYMHRLTHGWQYAGLALILFHFALPFVLLLSVDVKRNRVLLGSVAFLVLFMRVVDLLWLIVPAFHSETEQASSLFAPVIYLAAILGLSGLWFGYYLIQLTRAPLIPAYKPEVEGAAHGAVTNH